VRVTRPTHTQTHFTCTWHEHFILLLWVDQTLPVVPVTFPGQWRCKTSMCATIDVLMAMYAHTHIIVGGSESNHTETMSHESNGAIFANRVPFEAMDFEPSQAC